MQTLKMMLLLLLIYAHEWINDAHDHEMQVKLGKTNTRGVTTAAARDGIPVLCPCKDCMNQRKWQRTESVQMHLITRGFMPNYMIWTMHDEVGVNVPHENDDVSMADVALHEDVTNEEPIATVNDVFMNTLADDTEHDNGISQLVRNVESGFLSDRQLKS
jgi:hypothetical protein